MACSGQLGGKLGKSLQEDLGVKTPSDLLPYTESKLQELYGVNTGYVCLHCCFNGCATSRGVYTQPPFRRLIVVVYIFWFHQ